MSTRLCLLLGLIPLLLGAIVALLPSSTVGPLPNWSGWILLLPGLIFTGMAVPRRFLEPFAMALLVDGGVMMCQPWSLDLYRFSMAALLVAIVLFTVATHLGEKKFQPSESWAAWRTYAPLLIFGGAFLALLPFTFGLDELISKRQSGKIALPILLYLGLAFLCSGTILTPVAFGRRRMEADA